MCCIFQWFRKPKTRPHPLRFSIIFPPDEFPQLYKILNEAELPPHTIVLDGSHYYQTSATTVDAGSAKTSDGIAGSAPSM